MHPLAAAASRAASRAAWRVPPAARLPPLTRAMSGGACVWPGGEDPLMSPGWRPDVAQQQRKSSAPFMDEILGDPENFPGAACTPRPCAPAVPTPATASDCRVWACSRGAAAGGAGLAARSAAMRGAATSARMTPPSDDRLLPLVLTHRCAAVQRHHSRPRDPQPRPGPATACPGSCCCWWVASRTWPPRSVRPRKSGPQLDPAHPYHCRSPQHARHPGHGRCLGGPCLPRP
jgi:hypothetical protein